MEGFWRGKSLAWERGNSAKGRCLGVSRGICPGAFRTPSHPSSHRMSLCLQGPQSRFQTGKRDVREPDPQAPAQPLWKSEIWWLRCGQTGCCNCFVSAGPHQGRHSAHADSPLVSTERRRLHLFFALPLFISPQPPYPLFSISLTLNIV